jgi:hypothetical protein
MLVNLCYPLGWLRACVAIGNSAPALELFVSATIFYLAAIAFEYTNLRMISKPNWTVCVYRERRKEQKPWFT